MKFNSISNLKDLTRWANRLIPLVYDKSLSLYECMANLLQKFIQLNDNFSLLNDNFEELKKFIEGLDFNDMVKQQLIEMLESGALDSFFKTPQWLDVADWNIFAQHIYGDSTGQMSQQGMAIGKWDCGGHMILGAHDNLSQTGTVLSLYNLQTGELEERKTGLPINHVNCICWNPHTELFYIAPDGGRTENLNRIVVVNKELQIVDNIVLLVNSGSETVTYTNINSITYIEGLRQYYIRVDGYILLKTDEDFNVLSVHPEPMPEGIPNLVRQTIKSDGSYIYVSTWGGGTSSENDRFSRLDVYTLELKYLHTSYIDTYREIEDIDFYDGEMYIAFLLDKSGVVAKGTVQNDNKSYGHRITNATIYPMPTSVDRLTMFFNNSYTNFFCDGTNERPYNRVLLYTMLISQRFTALRLCLIGDFPQFNVNIKDSDANVEIYGYSDPVNEGLITIGSIYASNSKHLHFKNLRVINRNIVDNTGITIRATTVCFIESCMFDAPGVEDAIKFIGTHVFLRNSSFSANPTRYLIRTTEGGTIQMNANITIAGDITANLGLNTQMTYDWNMPTYMIYNNVNTSPKLAKSIGFSDGRTIDLFKITQDGRYHFGANIIVTNRPSGTTGVLYADVETQGNGIRVVKVYWGNYHCYICFINQSTGTTVGWQKIDTTAV